MGQGAGSCFCKKSVARCWPLFEQIGEVMENILFNDFYSEKINHLSLSHALDLHYKLNPHFTHWDKYISPIAKKLVKAHDITHIIFGCDTNLLGELRVQLWTKFGVKSFGWRETLMYARDKESKVLIKNPIGFYAMFKFFLKNINSIWLVRRQAKLFSKKWEYFQEDKYMTRTIGDIRQEFNIQLLPA
jgi:ubiquinone biosynthesis protein Coq4